MHIDYLKYENNMDYKLTCEVEREYAKICKLLKQIRLMHGYNQRELAEKACMSQQAISHIETGFKAPLIITTIRYLKGMNISLADVLSAYIEQNKVQSKP